MPAGGGAATADERLIRELYDHHAPALLGYTRQLLGGDTARAEDVVQETLLRAWRNPGAFDRGRPGGVSVRAWLLTVARNLVIDAERARHARPREVPAPDHDTLPDPAVRRDDDLDAVLLAHGMHEALTQLSPEHRAVVDQLYYLDRSVAQAATALGVPPGTVKSRAYYALRALRTACQDRGITL